jgi:hypothetical protein
VTAAKYGVVLLGSKAAGFGMISVVPKPGDARIIAEYSIEMLHSNTA